MAGAAGLLLAAPAITRAQTQAAGVALVIGNSKYHWEASLPNVRRDAPDIAKRLQALGLKTELVQDVGRDALFAAVEKFKAAVSGANLAVFYFAGHGASWEQDTYLVPVDTDLSNPGVVKTLLPVSAIGAAMRGAANRLLIFDNCRNNPADGWRQLAARQGAKVINANRLRSAAADSDPNTLVLYSTAPGRVAVDGPAGENSPFATSLLRNLAPASVDLMGLAAKLRRDLLIATDGQQVLWDQDTYRQSFLLSGRQGAAGGPVGDASRIVELRNSYAYARENALPLPEGLVAYRPAAASPHRDKVGAFKATIRSPTGPSNTLFIVLSVPDGGTAEIITTVQNDQGKLWRFVTGSVSGNRIEFVPDEGKPTILLDWRNANSGSVGLLNAGQGGQVGGGANTLSSPTFTRLD